MPAASRLRSVLLAPGSRPVVSLLLAVALVASGLSTMWWRGMGVERIDGLDLARPGETYELPFDTRLDDHEVRSHVLAASGRSVRNFLLVGVDGASDDVGGVVPDADTRAGGLTDALMLLTTDVETGQAALLSIPRDLWLDHRRSRINRVLADDGTQALADEVSSLTGVAVHHVVKVNLDGFADVVDAAGGVELGVDRPLRDPDAHLDLPEAGCYLMDGASSLTYVRSRKTETLAADGRWVPDQENTDFGRQAKQRRFLALAWDRLRGPRMVAAAPRLLAAAGDNVALDNDLGVAEVVALARAFQNLDADRVEQHQLPATPGRVGAASVVFLDADKAVPVLDRLASWPPEPDNEAAARPGSVSAPQQQSGAVSSGSAQAEAPADPCAQGQPRLIPPTARS
jgi:LCP family protein required for cell wall assembly